MVKKHQIAPYLNSAVGTDGLVDKTNPTWTRIKKTASFDLNMNPQTQEFDYIADEAPTTELERFNPSFNTPLVMYENEPDYEFIFGKFYNLAAGEKSNSPLPAHFNIYTSNINSFPVNTCCACSIYFQSIARRKLSLLPAA